VPGHRHASGRPTRRADVVSAEPLLLHDAGMVRSAALPDGSGHVEVCEGAGGQTSMIVCYNLDGMVRWQALPPDGKGDSWESLEVQSAAVVGNSSSRWRVSIDSATGSEVERRLRM
jgi:hypothetical protein